MFIETLQNASALLIRQRFELAELIGFESRNKYAIENESGQAIGFAAEQQKGLLGMLGRQFLGHWRTFDIQIFDAERRPVFRATHPFRFLFQRMELTDAEGRQVGALQQRFAILRKHFDVLDATGQTVMTMVSPLFRIWTFPFFRGEREVAVVRKKWSGVLSEVITDRDVFRVEYPEPMLSNDERALVLAAGIFIDLLYFERKARFDV